MIVTWFLWAWDESRFLSSSLLHSHRLIKWDIVENNDTYVPVQVVQYSSPDLEGED